MACDTVDTWLESVSQVHMTNIKVFVLVGLL